MVFMLRRNFLVFAWIFSLVALLGGCGRGNGLPADLLGHLAQQGIQIKPLGVHAPLSSRAGYVVTKFSPDVANRIVARFKLQKIDPANNQGQWVLDRAGATGAKELWGVSGRPSQFKLKNGGQFEYFYLLVTLDNQLYLLAEYAYG